MRLITAIAVLPALSFAAEVLLNRAEVKEPAFSFPPNNTPVSKVYVFGRPVYVRQPFVQPQRELSEAVVPIPRKHRQAETKYPLPQCYTNKSGFMCCNSKLEALIIDTFTRIRAARKNFHTCNVQSIANNLQKTLESEFNTQFEVISGIGDFASKAHFFSDLICKVEVEGRFIQAYATPGRHPKSDREPIPYAA